MPQVAEATDENDKTELIKPTITGEVSQNGKEVTDQIDPAKPFDVTVNFSFSIIKDSMIGSLAAGGIDDKSKQVDDGDYADFTLGENFKATDATGNSIPVYIKAPGNPDYDGKQVGTITLSQDGTGPVNARMNFHNPGRDFDFESDGPKTLTVHFTGHFQVQEQSSGTPGSNDRIVKILKKEYKLPEITETIKYNFSKSGKLDDETKKDLITWKSTVQKTLDKGKTSLGGETFKDELPKSVEYVEGSLKIKGEKVEDKDAYNKDSNTLSYVFPSDFGESNAVIEFQTKVIDPDKTMSVTNEAKLIIPNEDEKTAKTTVNVHHPLEIKKNFQKLNINDDGERELIWTIVAGAPNENYGAAWIGDILSGTSESEGRPNRVSLTYDHSLTGKEGSWTKVKDENIEILDQAATNEFPKFPEGKEKKCPELSKYKKEIYQLAEGWHDPTEPAEANSKYKPIQNHWVFVKDLNGLYRITVKLVYPKDAKIGSLKNDAEIHTCSDYHLAKTPPVNSGIGTISKSAQKSYKEDVINQGKMPWSISVDFTKVFPSDDRFVYECFYYGTEKEFSSDKNNLDTKGKLDKDVLKVLVDGKEGETYFNFNQGYVEKSLKYDTKKDEKTGKESPKLEETIIPLFNADGKRVGEVLKINGFTEIKNYNFKLQTRAQDIISKALKTPTASYDYKYKNTAVLAVGSGETFKTIPAVDRYELPGLLLNKFAMEHDADLKDTGSVSKNNYTSSYRTFITNIPLVDDSKTFNYKDRSILFRIDVNPQGLKLNEYIESLNGEKPEGDFTNLTIKDTLLDGLTLEPIEENGPDFYIYEANPSSAAFIDYGGVTVAGSAPFSSYLPPGTAVKKITPKDASVKFDKNNMTWNFENYQGKPYFIVIRAKVPKDIFDQKMKDTPQGEAITFKNSVSMEAGGHTLASDTGSASVKTYILSKEKPKVEGDYLNWTFDYKPFDIEFKNVVITDKLDQNISIPIDNDGNALLDNFKIERSNDMQPEGSYKDFKPVTKVKSNPKDGEVSVKYNVKDHCIYFDIPDTKDGEKPYSYRFTYKTIIRPTDLTADTIVNHVEMSAKNEQIGAHGKSEIKTQEYTAFATIKDFPYFVIKKVDKNDGTPLSGAVFQYKDSEDKVVNCLSDNKGKVYIIKLKTGDTEIKEIKAPDGYLKTKQVTTINVNDKNKVTLVSPKDGVGDGRFDTPFEVKNEKAKTIDISVTKKWVNDKANERPESITVNLFKNGELMEDMSLILDQSNGWKGIFKDMPLTDGDGTPIKYTISENKVPGYSSKITGNQTDGFVITNTKPGKPNEPGESGKPNDKNKPKSPGTGDNSFGYGWSVIAIAAGFGLIYLKRRQQHSKNN